MNEALIAAWNSVVSDKDVVYCLGDVSFKPEVLRTHLRRMRGVKILIVGNHDPVFKDMVSDDPKRYEVARLKAMQLGFADAHRELSLDIAEVAREAVAFSVHAPVGKWA